MEKSIIIGNDKTWIESNAVAQLNGLLDLKNVERVVGLPDLHVGKGPIGAVAACRNIIYPHIVGGDIGCGMGMFKIGVKKRRFKKDRIASKLKDINELKDIKTEDYYEEESPIKDLGSLGSGNHFAEFQVIDKMYNKEVFESLNISKDEVFLLIHSGSRAYGKEILDKYLNYDGIIPHSEEGKAYINEHNNAILWARRNREMVAKKLVEYLGFYQDVEEIINCIHNYIEVKEDLYIHRKGAVSSENGLVVIAGSRGSLTYIVKPTDNKEVSLYSLSHGAGRKWSRGTCKGRIKGKYNRDTIRETKLKGLVVCKDTELLYEEAPEAYKSIAQVINCLVEFNLIEVVATMKPIITYKG